MVNIASNDNKVAYGIKHFNIDTLADLSQINKNALTPGSTAFAIDTSKYYMLNGSRNWIEINPYGMGNSASDGGSTPTPPEDDDNPVYDGGSIDGSDPN